MALNRSSQCLAECFFQKNTRLPILLVPKPTYQNPGERRKTKGKQEKGVLWLWKIKRVELLLFFFHWRGHQKYRVPQFDNVDLDVLGLFTSRTERRRPVGFKFSLEKLKSLIS